jgi:UMF1 family MFS transporter
VVGWILYDLANTIFSMGVISLTFPLWVRDNVGESRADRAYGTISAISMGIIFVLSPLLGAMTDRARRRMPFLVVSTVLCVGLTMTMDRFGYLATVVAFILANIAYQAGTQYYDSLLPEVSHEGNRGKIGGIGVGIGYLGSYVAVGLSGVLAAQSKGSLFFAYGAAFLLFSIPCMVFVHERGNPRPGSFNLRIAIESVRQTIQTLRSSQRYPGLLRFLIGRMFYTDSINTVINVMALYVLNVAMSNGLDKSAGESQARLIMTFAITFAVLGGFAWGWLNDRIGPKRTLNAVLGCWVGIFILAALIGLIGLPMWVMYGMSAAAGACMGGVWAADRPYMLRLTPPARVGEFYGLYGMVGRFSAITGPVIWGAVTSLMNGWQSHGRAAATPVEGAHWARVSQGTAVLALLVMVVIGMWVLRPVSDAPRDWPPEDRHVEGGG